MPRPDRTTSASSAELPRLRSGSLTEEATRALLETILDRSFANDRLPNEPELAAQMGISRTTVRGALQSLERLGVISRAPGRGTVVRPQVDRSCMLLHRLIGFRGMLEARYDDVTVEQTFRVNPRGSEGAVESLGLSADEPVLMNDKTYLVDGKPAVQLWQEVPVKFLKPGLAEDLVSGRIEPPASIFVLSEQWPGHEIENTVLEMIPTVAPAGRNRVLGLKAGTPYLELRELHYSELNVPVAYAREAVRDDFVRFRLVRLR